MSSFAAVSQDIPIEERASKRLHSTVQLLYLLGLLKLFAAMLAPRLMAGRDPAPAVAWFAAGIALTLILANYLAKGRIWARNGTFAWAALHIAGIFFFLRLGVFALLEGMLGVMIGVTLLIASGLGAFDRA
jgi:hypothetical protein